LIGKPLDVKHRLAGNSRGQTTLNQELGLRVVADDRLPASPGEYQHHHGERCRRQRSPPPAQPEVAQQRRDQADPDVPDQNAGGESQAQTDAGTDVTTAAGPNRGEHGHQLPEDVEWLRLDRPADPPPGPVKRQREAEDQGRLRPINRPKPSPGQQDRSHCAAAGEEMCCLDRAAEGPPKKGECGRIPRWEVCMARRSWLADFTITAAGCQRLAKDRITRTVEPRRGMEVRVQPDRRHRDDRHEQPRTKTRPRPPSNPSHRPRPPEAWTRSSSPG